MTTLTRNTDLLKQGVHEHPEIDTTIGCFIRCLTHSDAPALAVERFGLTEPILRIAEGIFESLPPEEAEQFFYDFPNAVATDGKDLSLVHWVFLGETLRNLPSQCPEIQAVIDAVIDHMNSCYEQFGPPPGGFSNTWGKDVVDAADAASAAGVVRGAAWDAAWAAWTAARAAASAAACDAARAASDAAWDAARDASAAARASSAAAWTAARAAASAAASAAETRRQRESLLRLIREAPVVTPS
jgi:hypothetical protein